MGWATQEWRYQYTKNHRDKAALHGQSLDESAAHLRPVAYCMRRLVPKTEPPGFGIVVTVTSMLAYLSGGLAALALIFFVMGATRTQQRLSASGLRVGIYAAKVGRLLVIRRVDWRCAIYLLYAALFLLAVSLLSTGPFFTEPSGNLVGGVLVIAFILMLVLIVLLVARHILLSRALRDLDSRVQD